MLVKEPVKPSDKAEYLFPAAQQKEKENRQPQHDGKARRDEDLGHRPEAEKQSEAPQHRSQTQQDDGDGIEDEIDDQRHCHRAGGDAVPDHEHGAGRLSAGGRRGHGGKVDIRRAEEHAAPESGPVADPLQDPPDALRLHDDEQQNAHAGRQKI